MRVRTFIFYHAEEREKKTQGERYKKTTREREREKKKRSQKKYIRKEHYPRAHFSLDTKNDFDAERRRIIEYSADDVRGHVRVRRRGRGRHLGRHPGVDFLHAIETKQNKTNVRVRVAFGVVFVSRDIRRRGETERDGTRERDWVERKSVSGKDDEHVEEGKTF
tara:strand:+ start:45 stop:536 length:492 start_codon:yes stop_codon:yes gene_type:complete